LGTLLTARNELNLEIEKQINAANRAYHVLPLLKIQLIPRSTKKIIYKTLIRPIITFGAEAWTLNYGLCNWWAVFERKILRWIFGAVKINNQWRSRNNN
jgi:hypothetical protein